MPGTTTLTLSNEQLSANLFDQVEKLVQTKDHPYTVAEDALASAVKIPSPGERTVVRFSTHDHSQQRRAVTGHEAIPVFAQPTLTPGFQGWAAVFQPVFISKMDEQRNSGKMAVVSILDDRVRSVTRHMRRSLQQVLLKGPAASSSWGGVPEWEDHLTLNGGDSVTGIVEDQVDGTNTLHGINKATLPLATNEQLHNFFKDCAGDASANLLAAFYDITVDQAIRLGEDFNYGQVWYASGNCVKFMKQNLRSFEQYVNTDDLDDGKRRWARYNGIKVKPTAELPNAGTATTTNPWSALLINWSAGDREDDGSGAQLRCATGWVMDWTPFEDLPGTLGTRYALCKYWGQLISTNPGRNGLIVDAEVF